MHFSSVIPANDTIESVFGHRNFPRRERGSNLRLLAPEASAYPLSYHAFTLNAGVVALWFSGDPGKKPCIFVIFQGGGLDPLPPPLWIRACHQFIKEHLKKNLQFTLSENVNLMRNCVVVPFLWPVILFGNFWGRIWESFPIQNGLYFPNFMYFSFYFPNFNTIFSQMCRKR